LPINSPGETEPRPRGSLLAPIVPRDERLRAAASGPEGPEWLDWRSVPRGCRLQRDRCYPGAICTRFNSSQINPPALFGGNYGCRFGFFVHAISPSTASHYIPGSSNTGQAACYQMILIRKRRKRIRSMTGAILSSRGGTDSGPNRDSGWSRSRQAGFQNHRGNRRY
jgi:hypothetical protein